MELFLSDDKTKLKQLASSVSRWRTKKLSQISYELLLLLLEQLPSKTLIATVFPYLCTEKRFIPTHKPYGLILSSFPNLWKFSPNNSTISKKTEWEERCSCTVTGNKSLWQYFWLIFLCLTQRGKSEACKKHAGNSSTGDYTDTCPGREQSWAL